MRNDEELARLEAEVARLTHILSAMRAEPSTRVPSAPEDASQTPSVADLVAERERAVVDAEKRVERLAGECEGLVSAVHLELARTLGRREQQVAELEASRSAGEERITQLEASLRSSEERLADVAGQLAENRRQVQDTAARIDQLVSERDRLAAELGATRAGLAHIRGSRWWKVGSAYWAFQRALHRTIRRLAAVARGTPAAVGNPPGNATGVSAPPPSAAALEPGVQPHRTHDARYDVVCFPIIDWGFRFQRPQQLMKRLAARGHRVFYVAQGFRQQGPPYALHEVAQNVYEVTLRARPANVYQDPLTPEATDEMFASLDALRRDESLGATVSIVQLPFWWPVASKAWRELAWPVVYDCMDDHAGFSTNRPDMLAQEQELVRGARLVCASSEKLRAHVVQSNPNCLLLPNACDFEHFSGVGPPPRGPRPRVGYYGAIADWFDSDLVADLAERRQDWDFVLVGSTFTADTSRLATLPNVTLPGEQPYAGLPEWLGQLDVLIIPFKRVPLTEATNPVKAYEILAAGRPLVSVPLPELQAMAPHVRLAGTVDEFEREIVEALAERDDERIAGRRAFASRNTWETRADALDAAICRTFPLVSIVVVTYNNLDLNRQCLESVFGRTEWPNFEVIVVDNASDDGTPEYLAEALRELPTLHVILNDENEGFARANNLGLARASGDFLVLLNNDTVVPRGWLSPLIRHLHLDQELGLVGPVSNAIGNEAQIEVGYQDVADMPAWAEAYVRDHDGESFGIPMLAMFCVALRRDVFENVGGLDERFEVGMFEDDDFARRVRLAGFELRCARDSFVHHWQKASFRLLGEPEYLKLYHRNRRRFEQKWGKIGHSRTGSRSPAGLEELYRAADGGNGVVVFPPSVGWGIHLFQRPHHLARTFARLGYAVVYDCSNAHDDVERLRAIEPGVYLYRGAFEDLHRLHEPIVWTFPYNFHFATTFPYGARTVYDWIDDLSVFTAWDSALLARNHEQALEKATVVAAVAQPLYDEARRTRSDALYLPNAVEYEHFARLPAPTADPKLTALSDGRPVAGYYGALARWFDDDLLDETAALRPDWTFLLVGPMYEGGLRGARSLRRPNVIWVGPRDYRVLPGYAAWFDVALIPFRVEPITLATSPLKLYEYFAAGRPVISTPLPECEAFPEVRIVRSATELASALDAAHSDGRDPGFVERLRAIGRRNSWQARVETVLNCWSGGVSSTAAPEDAGTPRGEPPPDSENASPDDMTKARDRVWCVTPSTHASLPSPLGPPLRPQRPSAQSAPRTEGGCRVADLFARFSRPDNSRFFAALSDHLASVENDPSLAMYFEYAITTNDRGRALADVIAQRRPVQGVRVLDVGCAYGGMLVAFVERGCSAVGIEINELLLRLAEANLADQGVAAPLIRQDASEGCPEFESAFDVIVANDVIEHIANLDAFLDNLGLWLRPRGRAYLEIPNGNAVSAVVSDGHHSLFGITLLEYPDAAAYLRSARGSEYDTYNYLSLTEYQERFRQRGLSTQILPRTWEGQSLARVHEDLKGLGDSGSSALAGVPQTVRDVLAARLAAYVDAARRDLERLPEADAILRYGASFWTVELTHSSDS